MEEILGYIDTITFVNHENGFTIAKLRENKKDGFTTIVGIMPSVQPGETLSCEGNWKIHPTFGRQFEVEKYNIESPSDAIGIQKYLESGLIKGIGPYYAEQIVKKFGIDTLKIIDETPFRLSEIEGIGEKRIIKIKECFDEQRSIREVIIFLRTYGVSPAYAQKIFKHYGDKSIAKVKENPYQLAYDIFGIGFKIADNIARHMGFETNSPLRIASGIEYVLFELTNRGHTCYPETYFFSHAEKILQVKEKLIKIELEKLIQLNQIYRKEILHNQKKSSFIWLKTLYNYEQGIAQELLRIKEAPSFLRTFEVKKAVTWVQDVQDIKLAEKQASAVEQSITEKLHIITGGPGTGKSTITNCILQISEKLTNKIVLAAPTGRAAKRLTQITNKKAYTIHSLLEYDFKGHSFKKDQHNPLKCDLLIIDEASMIDTFLMHSLLKAIPDTARVIFVGDIDQLPSVGPGNVLKDIISSNVVHLTRLTQIYRQSEHSKIVINAHRINSGQFPEIDNDENSDFHFIPLADSEQIKNKIVELVKKELPEKKNLHPLDQIQVLSPMKKGIIGTENLNLILQDALNPSATPLFRAGHRFHVNDKVMQIKNNYDKKVFNGDIGRILSIDPIEQEVIISFDQKLIEYDFSDLDEIRLAYAVSVHKYQGSEYPCIIVPIHTCHYKLLYRNLLYTAVTRGKKLVILIGTKQAIAIAVKNNDVLKRYTGLEDALQTNTSAQQVLLPGFEL